MAATFDARTSRLISLAPPSAAERIAESDQCGSNALAPEAGVNHDALERGQLFDPQDARYRKAGKHAAKIRDRRKSEKRSGWIGEQNLLVIGEPPVGRRNRLSGDSQQ